MAFLGITDFESGSESDVEPEREQDESYKEVRETLIKLSMENLSLTKEKERLEVELSLVRLELQREAELAKESVGLIKEKPILVKHAEELKEEVVAERKVSADLQEKLDQQNKNIKMLTEPKQLEKIMCAGGTENSHMGLGYRGRQNGDTGLSKCGNNTSSGESGKLTKYG
ncbi:hypothetical protein F2Q69_00033207 [Brassica cretica]|uniref:Uncharacterized protein n=1 Tax=Brassica cretica TaxID=69181 RepID=A0A8S9SQU5_BRACR|nr:hypothetical protein F2Q69_00033207 [Brassica cretica]